MNGGHDMMMIVVVIETLLKTSMSADVLLLVLLPDGSCFSFSPLRFARNSLLDIDIELAERTAKCDSCGMQCHAWDS